MNYEHLSILYEGLLSKIKEVPLINVYVCCLSVGYQDFVCVVSPSIQSFIFNSSNRHRHGIPMTSYWNVLPKSVLATVLQWWLPSTSKKKYACLQLGKQVCLLTNNTSHQSPLFFPSSHVPPPPAFV